MYSTHTKYIYINIKFSPKYPQSALAKLAAVKDAGQQDENHVKLKHF